MAEPSAICIRCKNPDLKYGVCVRCLDRQANSVLEVAIPLGQRLDGVMPMTLARHLDRYPQR